MNVKQFLEQPVLKSFINGQFVEGTQGAVDVTDPATGELLTKVSMCDETDADRAVKAAHSAFAQWRDMGVEKRNEILLRLAKLIEENNPILAELEARDVGKTYELASTFDIPFGMEGLNFFTKVAAETDYDVDRKLTITDGRTFKKPYGACSFIFPWNFPFALCLWGISPALAAGNTVVIKPAVETPISTLYFCQLAKEAGIPDGVINVVVGRGTVIGEAIVTHPLVKRTSFTGSTPVGRRVGELSAKNLKPAKLELGGKGAAVVFPDVDVKQSAIDLCGAITMNTGQVCCTATRWYVHEDILEQFIAEAKAELAKVVLGPGMDSKNTMGPLCTQKQLNTVLDFIAKGQGEGAELLCGGHRYHHPDYPKGVYMEPTLLTGPEDNVCVAEEIFGPVAYIIPFYDEADVVERVNLNPYGLSNSVWSADLDRANRVARALTAGNCWINAHNVFEYGLPYGACNQSGCGGGVNSVETFEDYLHHQTIASIR